MNKDGNNSDQQSKSGLQPPNDPINQQTLTNKKNQLDKNTLLAVKKSEQINQINNNTKIQQVDSGKILRNFFVKFNDFFKAVNTFFTTKNKNDEKINKIINEIHEVLKQQLTTLQTTHKTLQLNNTNINTEKEVLTKIKIFLNNISVDTFSDINSNVQNIESALNTLISNQQNINNVTPKNSSTFAVEKYLESYQTVMEKFNNALSITADELLNFKTNIIYEQGDRINFERDTMKELFTNLTNTFENKLDSVTTAINNNINRTTENPVNVNDVIASVNNLITKIDETNIYLDNLLEINESNLNKENILTETGSNNVINETSVNKSTNINNYPTNTVQYNITNEPISDREYFDKVIDYIDNFIDTQSRV